MSRKKSIETHQLYYRNQEKNNNFYLFQNLTLNRKCFIMCLDKILLLTFIILKRILLLFFFSLK